MQIGRIRRETRKYRTLEGSGGMITTIYKKNCWGSWEQLLGYVIPDGDRLVILIDNRK